MDEAEKYQQRLQAIAEKRRLQEEQERMKREMEEERLKLQQLKRKSLRDQWLMDALPSAPDGPGTNSPVWEPQAQEPHKEHGDELQTEGPLFTEEQLKNLEDGYSQAHTDGATQDAGELRVKTPGGDTEHLAHWTQDGVKDDTPPEGLRPHPHTQMAPLKNGQEARSVLGVVELQVERDLKTGATVILSVAPVAPGETGTAGETVFDDGRRSVQAVGGAAATPGPEELEQILDALTGAGLQAMLGDEKVIPNGKEEGEEWREEQEERREEDIEQREEEAQGTPAVENGFETDTDACGNSTHSAPQQEVTPSSPERWESPQLGAGGREGAAEGGREAEGWGGPVTMTFLGFTEAESGEEDVGEIIRAERVIITEEGEEPPPGGAEKPSVPPTDNPTPEESGIILASAEQAPDSELQGEDTPTAERGAETEEGGAQEPTPLQQGQGWEVQPPEGSTLEITADPSQVLLSVTALAPDAREEGGAEAEAQAELPQDISPGGTGGGATPQRERTGAPELQPPTRAAGEQVPVTPAELQPLVSQTKENPQLSHLQPSRAEAGGAPKHKSCHCCSVM